MSFDPAADPWGAAMLGTAVVVVLAVFVLVAAMVTRTPARAGKRLLGLGCFLFLGTAAGGTWERIVQHQREAAEAAKPPRETVTIVAPEPPDDDDKDDDGKAGGDDADRVDAAADDAGSEPAAADAGEAGDDAAPPDGDPSADDDDGTEPEPATPEPPPIAEVEPVFDLSKIELDPPAPLPSDPDERAKAIALVLYNARDLSQDARRCADTREVAEAWAQLQALPPGTEHVDQAVNRVEGCRKKARTSKAYWVRRQRIEARNAFANELPAELRIDESYVFVNVRGQSHEKIRIGGKSISEARAKKLLAAGMEAQLLELGFVEATFASGTDTLTKDLEPESDSSVTDKVMARWGLDQPLSLPPPTPE